MDLADSCFSLLAESNRSAIISDEMERQRLRRNPKKLMTTCGANAAIVLATLMILASIANAQRGNANAPTKSEHYVKEKPVFV